MIFFSVWLYTYSREVLRESFELPRIILCNRNFRYFRNFSNAPTRYGWAFGFDLFQPAKPPQRAKAKNSSQSIAPQRTQPHTGWALGFDLFQPTKPTQRAKAQNSSPANPRSAQPLTCPSLRLTAASGWAPPPPPPAPLRSAPLRSNE